MPKRLLTPTGRAAQAVAAALIALAASPSPLQASTGAHHQPVPHLAWSLPFLLLLLAIAILPLVPRVSHWWEHNHNKLFVGLALSGAILAHYAFRPFGFHDAEPGLSTVRAVVEHAVLEEYVPFIVLLFTLYVVAGGLQLRGDLRATPAVNTAFLGIGAVIASLIGTTGASMVLIRPLLETNRERTHVRHTVVFFIFLVSNIGGLLLPTGDPPLFLGYLKGVPFLWTARLWMEWGVCVGSLLTTYFIWDSWAYGQEEPTDLARDEARRTPLRLHGALNLLWLIGVVLAAALVVPGKPLLGVGPVVGPYVREGAMLGLALLSLATTPRGLRREVEFTYAAILEVAALFLGIFLTMQVPIEVLRALGPELGLTKPLDFFWATGSLSSFLDNAPTYVVFLETAKSLGPAAGTDMVALTDGAVRADLLAAISVSAVFMGANTYIGNGPNLMVKTIAEHRGVAMPSFFGYMLYSGLILLPLFALVTILFVGR